jgi:histidyl-tRNA synthetase
MAFERVKGTRDFYPEEKEVMNWMFDLFRQCAVKYGYSEVESPAIESQSLLCEKEGEEIKQQIFTLEKKGKEQLGLRFDITVPLARMFISKQKELPKPVKWFYITRMWRYEAPQRGRLREFYQFGVELFGSDKPETDAEIISLAIDSMLALGLKKKDFFVKVNDRDLLQGLIEGLGIGKVEEVMIVIDKIAKISEEEFVAELEELGLTQDQIKKLDKIIKTKDLDKLKDLNPLAKKGLEKLKQVLALLKDKKDFIEVDLSIARGLAYYTGTVFEIYDKEMKYRALCGGGRYDKMIKSFGGDDCAATGFATGFATVNLLLDEKMLLPDKKPGVDYYIAPVDKKVFDKAMEIASKLRKNNSVDIDLMERKLTKQFDYADRIGAKKIIVVGQKDLEKGEVTVRDMETGKEEKVKLNSL